MGKIGKARARSNFTDDELIAELRKRAAWKSAAGSVTFNNVMSEAADRLEALTTDRHDCGCDTSACGIHG